jgi:hypothetical protein
MAGLFKPGCCRTQSHVSYLTIGSA